MYSGNIIIGTFKSGAHLAGVVRAVDRGADVDAAKVHQAAHRDVAAAAKHLSSETGNDDWLAELDHYPAIDINLSLSRVFADITDAAHQSAARQVRAIQATHKDSEDLINAGAYSSGSSAAVDKAIELMPQLNQYLKQNLHEPSSFSNTRQSLIELGALWN